MATARKKIIGITGDVNPKYGSGVVYQDQYGIHWEFWESLGEEDEKGKEKYIVYRGDVPDDVFAEYNWLKAEGVASSIGMDVEELKALGRSKKIGDRVQALEAIFPQYESAENFDSYPLELTIGEINRRWGRVFSSARHTSGPRWKENKGIGSKRSNRKPNPEPRLGPTDSKGKPLDHISYGHYRVSDAEASRLAHGVGKKLPTSGMELRVELPDGKLAWLTQTPYRHYTDAPKRGWVWALSGFKPEYEWPMRWTGKTYP